jgi:MscS family membrane protein
MDQLLTQDMKQMAENTLWLIPNWKWIAFAASFLIAYIIRHVFSFLFRQLRQSSKFLTPLPAAAKKALQGTVDRNVGALFGAMALFLFIDVLALPPAMDKYSTLLVRILFSFHFMVMLYKVVDAVGNHFEEDAASNPSSLEAQLIPFITKTAKVILLVFGGLVMIQSFGINVMSLLAGLGLGGLALALAAQDTAANVFGSVTILLDRPFKVGDWIKVTDTEGIVEEIGFRSTRIRTFYKSLITIPNSVIAKEKIDNMGERPQHRIRHVFGLTYDTNPQKMRQFIEGVKEILRNHPLVDQEVVRVNLTGYNSSSLDVTVVFFLDTIDTTVEFETQEQILLMIWSLAESLKVEFAFPTQTLHVPALTKA